jgi:hypothetical protein
VVGAARSACLGHTTLLGLLWVIRVGPTRPTSSPHVRCTSDTSRTCALQRFDAECHQRTHAPQQTNQILNHLVGPGEQHRRRLESRLRSGHSRRALFDHLVGKSNQTLRERGHRGPHASARTRPAAQRMSPSWPLAHIRGWSPRRARRQEDPADGSARAPFRSLVFAWRRGGCRGLRLRHNHSNTR